MPSRIAVLDHAGRVVRAGKAFQALVRPAEPLAGAAAETVFGVALGAPAAAAIRATLADRKPRLFTARAAEGCTAGLLAVTVCFVPRSGRGRPIRFLMHAEAAGPCPSAAGRPPRGTVQPMDERLAGVVHDFNNLLAVIAASAEAGRERATHDPALLQDLDAISAAAGRGTALVRKLAALNGEEAPAAPQAVDLNAAVQALAPLVRRALGAGIALDVVAAGTPPLAWLDPVGLDQAVLNLAVNARDAMPGGGRLTLRTEHRDGYATLEVADAGQGIPPDLLPTVLRPGVSTKRASGGQGLGLASVLEIVRQGRGTLVIESARGEGTTVRLCFPVARAPGATGRLLLLVEDEALVRGLAARALARHGWEVLLAESIAAALEAAESRLADIALVVADLSLPDGDGLALIRALRARRPGLPAVLASGYPAGALADGEHGLHLLAKPYSVDDLARACAEAAGPS